ncbi:hypothetical protein HYQ46_002702 [Verticillium longisporum]|nr:hypothetical protein HYQ46_002702 [Verticillium longisporum]
MRTLIKCRVDVVGKLNLGDGTHTLGGGANGKAHNALLGERCVEDAIVAVCLGELHRAAEDAAKGDILAKDHDCIVLGEGCREGVVDSLEESIGRLSFALGAWEE